MDIPIQVGQHYQSKRGGIYTVTFFNDDVVLLYDGRHYRLESTPYFESLVDAGNFELQDDIELSDSEVEIPYENIHSIGGATAENLREAGFVTPKDVDRVSSEKILEVDGLGQTGLENIRSWVENNE